MKIIYPAALVLALLALLLPTTMVKNNPPEPTEPPAETAAPSPSPTDTMDGARTVLLYVDGKPETVYMDDYLVGVVASEMPASFESAALEAQAIVARTYAAYRSAGDTHNGGVCSDPNCCEAYAKEAELRQKWGGTYDIYMAKIRDAVAATDGLMLTWEGEPVLAAFHSSSSGYTENCGDVWGTALPYLVSVETPETAEQVRNFVANITFTAVEFKNTVMATLPGAIFVSGPEGWLTEPEYTASGRLASVRVGGVRITGTELRRLFGLRSTRVSWSVSGDGIAFRTEGYGHGVGMSQYGANELAKSGCTAEDILAHYYPGTKLEVNVEKKSVPV